MKPLIVAMAADLGTPLAGAQLDLSGIETELTAREYSGIAHPLITTVFLQAN
jgi:hypothetical protein